MFVLLTLSALAGDQHLVYDLSVNGEVVGTRDVTIRYYARAGGERRVVEAVTQVQLLNNRLDARTVGQSNPRGASFSTAAEINGDLLHIQGVQLPEGDWRLELADGKTVNEQTVRGTTVFTSMDLVDPGRTSLLAGTGSGALVFTETGDVYTGSLGAGVAATVTIGTRRVPVTRYGFTTSTGTQARFDVDGEGLLLVSEMSWFGVPITATLRTLPEARDFGTVDTLEMLGTPVGEEAL